MDKIKILFFSAPDFTDNALYLYEYLKSLNDKRFQFVWLVDHPDEFEDNDDTKFISRVSDLTILEDLKFTFTSHTTSELTYRRFNDSHVIVNLSHGIGVKGQKREVHRDPHYPSSLFDYIVSLGGPMADEAVFIFNNMPDKSKILPTGYPRNDHLFNEKKEEKTFSTRILWMPTFKQSLNKNYSEEYFDNETGISLFDTKESLIEIERWLNENNLFIFMKMHRLQEDLEIYKWINDSMKRIHVTKNSGICGDFYGRLNDFDALLTDYSSVAVDFLFLDKPEGFIFTDIKDYEKSRGDFCADPVKYSAGHHIYTIEDFKKFCLDVKRGLDPYSEKRKRVLNDFCKNIDGNSSERIYKFICDKIKDEK